MKCLVLSLLLFASCQFSSDSNKSETVVAQRQTILQPNGLTVEERFAVPDSFKRVEGSAFAQYLRSLSLYPHGKQVRLFNGQLKGNQSAQAAVIKMDVGKQDLQQCADAVMRLRAEFLYQTKRFEDLYFNFTNGFKAKYSLWRSGKGIQVRGNNVRWVHNGSNNGSYASFRKYLDKVFMYAGTASLEKELQTKDINKITPGDVFIKGGHPGHAVMVLDVARNNKGDKVFMLAQSYMPAQEIHVLKNPSSKTLSPWYKLSEINDVLITPEWTFGTDQLKSFP